MIAKPGHEVFPCIFGSWVTFRDNLESLYVYNLETREDRRIVANSMGSGRPHIYRNKVVWSDDRNSFESDIYMYDLELDRERAICSHSGYQSNPCVYEDKIVWQDDRNGNEDIYMFSLSTGIETAITISPMVEKYPCIYKNQVVWWTQDEEDSFWGYHLTLYDIETRIKTHLSNLVALPTPLDMYENLVVYQDLSRIHGAEDVFLYDLDAGVEIPICTEVGGQFRPRIYGDKIVWQDTRHSNGVDVADVYMYDLVIKAETRITSSSVTNRGGSPTPDIYEDKIVWSDDRNDYQCDIYLMELPKWSAAEIIHLSTSSRQLAPPNHYTCEPEEEVLIMVIVRNTGSVNLDLNVALRIYRILEHVPDELLYDSTSSGDDQEIALKPGEQTQTLEFCWTIPEKPDVPAYSVEATVMDRHSPDQLFDSAIGPILHVVYDNGASGSGAALVQSLYPDLGTEESVSNFVKVGAHIAFETVLHKAALAISTRLLGSVAFTFLTECVTLGGYPNVAEVRFLNSEDGAMETEIIAYEDQPIPVIVIYSPGDQVVWPEIRVEKETGFLQRELVTSFSIPGYFWLGNVHIIYLKNPLTFSTSGTYFVRVIDCYENPPFVPTEARVIVKAAERLVVSVESPVSLMVTAPDGLRAGYDPETETVFNEILGSTYSGSETEPQWVTLLDPVNGTYEITLVGTDIGDFNLTAKHVAFNQTNTESRSGHISIGEIKSFLADITGNDLTLRTLTGMQAPPLWILGLAFVFIVTVGVTLFIWKKGIGKASKQGN